jgi:hypothetical protein
MNLSLTVYGMESTLAHKLIVIRCIRCVLFVKWSDMKFSMVGPIYFGGSFLHFIKIELMSGITAIHVL